MNFYNFFLLIIGVLSIITFNGCTQYKSSQSTVYSSKSSVLIAEDSKVLSQNKHSFPKQNSINIESANCRGNKKAENKGSDKIGILIADQKFQTEMYERALKSYKEGNASKADILKYERKASKEENDVINAERNFNSGISGK